MLDAPCIAMVVAEACGYRLLFEQLGQFHRFRTDVVLRDAA
jgi:hypothetical protein